MRSPYGLEMSESCFNCKLRSTGFFCQLQAPALRDFDSVKSVAVYPKGAVLFMEGQDPRGVFVLCEGRVKLSTTSVEGKTLILRIAEPGQVLGLTATLSAEPYELTAEIVYPSQVAFVSRNDFLHFVSKNPQACLNVAREASNHYKAACEQLRTLGLSASAPEKLAKLLLDWSARGQETTQGTRVTLPLTHEEIAEFIGTSRETVTRTLSEFKTRRLVALKGSTLMISNRAALESFVSA